LEACLEAAKGRWEHGVCLGDLVGYGPDPNQVTTRLRGLPIKTIRGNHDKAACGLASFEEFNPVARAAAEWTHGQLNPENRAFLTELPRGPLTSDGLTFVHGSLHDEDEYVFAPSQALDALLETISPVTFFGHTHYQGGFAYQRESLDLLQLRPRGNEQFAALRLMAGKRYLLNPGSVGQPRDGDPRAAFAIADLGHHVVEFWRVAYDIEGVQRRMVQAGLPETLVLRLSVGR
jgi:diadenosine tetraphosphatase ApaH/serine/threonine PP2A family protein phosphatase